MSSNLRDFQKTEIKRLKEKIQKADLPVKVKRKAFLEVERLKLISPASGEYNLIWSYIDWIINLPWKNSSAGRIDVEKLEEVLDKEYFGQKKMKERIYEYFSIRKLRKEMKGSILCFVGPPGTGKSSLAKAIAQALKRKYLSLNVAGFTENRQLKGERNGFSGGQPGAVIKSLREAGCNDPLILLEGVDRIGNGVPKGEIISALLEILDPENNQYFIDSYLGLSFDLSRVLFIAKAHNAEEIPDALMDLFEMVEFTGFIEEEKLEIAKRYIIPSQIKIHGLSQKEVQITDGAIKKIIREYAIEEGIRVLQREIITIYRKVARMRASGEKVFWKILPQSLPKYLGTPVYIPDIAEKKPEVGLVCGLAWTPSGGDVMFIEGLKMKGSGQVFSTGQLGGIIKETIQTAHSYIRSQASLLGINSKDFTDYDIHIHFPREAVPKDGPSAGIAISLVIASVMSGMPIRNDMAMSGEVSLRGNVFSVSGIKEKLSAARRAGIKKVILPKDNQKSLPDLPQKLREEVEFIWVEKMEEVFENALIGFRKQEKLLKAIQKEVKKLKKKNNRKKRLEGK
ncbi:MAG: AAA family ATPase [candidate division Zixibacteria bacterium]|nr:AAA family ATPase [candidate division Zixibacteria bacterium]